MSLKNEIEKIIQAERAKLERRDREHKGYHERQRYRFQPLRALLDELATSIDPAHLKASVRQDGATIEVGSREGDRMHFAADARWQIGPNYDVRFRAGEGESLFLEAPGFWIVETVYYRFPEYNTRENTLTFDTEEHVMSYLVGKIAERVASYRHLSAKKEGQR